MFARLALAASLAFLAATAGASFSSDQLCAATGNSSGCIPDPRLHGRPPESNAQREPACDAACRAEETRRYQEARDAMVEPAPVRRIDAPLKVLLREVVRLRESQTDALESLAGAIAAPLARDAVVRLGLWAASALLSAEAWETFVEAIESGKLAVAVRRACQSLPGLDCEKETDCNKARRSADQAQECRDALNELGKSLRGKAAELVGNHMRALHAHAKRCAERFDGPDGLMTKSHARVHPACDPEGGWRCDDLTDCDDIKRNLGLGQACLAERQRHSRECYEGAPHPGHESKINDVSAGIKKCQEALIPCP